MLKHIPMVFSTLKQEVLIAFSNFEISERENIYDYAQMALSFGFWFTSKCKPACLKYWIETYWWDTRPRNVAHLDWKCQCYEHLGCTNVIYVYYVYILNFESEFHT